MDTSLRGVSVSCQCACSEHLAPAATSAVAAVFGENEPASIALGSEAPDHRFGHQTPRIANITNEVVEVDAAGPRRARKRSGDPGGVASYNAELNRPLVGAPLRVGQVWHLQHEEAQALEPATLSLYANGFEVRPDNGGNTVTVSWSPFSLVQACRLHSVQADAALPWLRLFKVSVFHHGVVHHFAARDEDSEASMRARCVADVARALRMLSASLFPPFRIRSDPVVGASWTSTRLVAGYLLMCDNQDIAVVYCELHCHWDAIAAFAVYEDDSCDTRFMRVALGVHTCISERVGVDCSCFSIDGHHFSARSSAEKAFWLRAVSNVKVKLRHRAENPSGEELLHYRSSIAECASSIRTPDSVPEPVLQKRVVPSPASGQNRGGYNKSSNGRPEEYPSGKQASDSGGSAAKEPPRANKGGPGLLIGRGGFVRPPAPPRLPCESSSGTAPPALLQIGQDLPPDMPFIKSSGPGEAAQQKASLGDGRQKDAAESGAPPEDEHDLLAPPGPDLGN